MKNIKLFIVLLIASFSVISCEEVVNVDLDTAAPKLVIDASIKWEKGTTGNVQKIKLTTTTDYYSNNHSCGNRSYCYCYQHDFEHSGNLSIYRKRTNRRIYLQQLSSRYWQ